MHYVAEFSDDRQELALVKCMLCNSRRDEPEDSPILRSVGYNAFDGTCLMFLLPLPTGARAKNLLIPKESL